MALGAQFVITADGSKALSAINAVQQGFQSLTNTVKGELSQKLKAIFTVTAIEEATRRTGEWAQALERSAIAAGTSSETLQALNLLAARTNLDPSKVTGFFDELDIKRREALAGNENLRNSFLKMGYTLKDLTSGSKFKLFEILMNNKGQFTAGTPMGGHAEALIGSGNLPSYDTMRQGLGGGTFSQFKQGGIDSGAIVGGETTSEMSEMWTDIKNDLSEGLQALSPVGKFLLTIAKMLSGLFSAIAFLASDLLTMVNGILHGDWDKIKDAFEKFATMFANIGFSLEKMIAGVIDFISGWISKIPGLGGSKTNLVSKIQRNQDEMNENLNTSHARVRAGEAVGDIIGTIGLGGTGVAESVGAKGMGFAKDMGFTKAAVKSAGETEAMVEGIFPYLGKEFAERRTEIRELNKITAMNTANPELNRIIDLKWQLNKKNGLTDEESRAEMFGYFKSGQSKAYNKVKAGLDEKIVQAKINIKNSGEIGGVVGTLVGVGLSASLIPKTKGGSPSEEQAFSGRLGGIGASSFSGESGSMLSMGGTFGMGIQSRILKLNERMVDLLTSINEVLITSKGNLDYVDNPNSMPSL